MVGWVGGWAGGRVGGWVGGWVDRWVGGWVGGGKRGGVAFAWAVLPPAKCVAHARGTSDRTSNTSRLERRKHHLKQKYTVREGHI